MGRRQHATKEGHHLLHEHQGRLPCLFLPLEAIRSLQQRLRQADPNVQRTQLAGLQP